MDAALPQAAGQGAQHRAICSSPTAIFLAFHQSQQPTLYLVWVPPPPHSMKLKDVIKLGSPRTSQTPRAHSQEWCVLHESWGEVSCPSSGATLGQVPARGKAGAMPGATVEIEKLDVLSSPPLKQCSCELHWFPFWLRHLLVLSVLSHCILV